MEFGDTVRLADACSLFRFGTRPLKEIVVHQSPRRPQKAERANKGTTGKVTTTLMQQAGSAMLTFSGETQSGVKLSGEITCRKVAAE